MNWILMDPTGEHHVSEGGGLSKINESSPMIFPSDVHAQLYAQNSSIRTPLIPTKQTAVQMCQTLIQERSRLRDAQQMPRSEVEFLTYAALSISAITEGRAAEILGLDRLQVREGLQQWLAKQPEYVQKSAEFAQSYPVEGQEPEHVWVLQACLKPDAEFSTVGIFKAVPSNLNSLGWERPSAEGCLDVWTKRTDQAIYSLQKLYVQTSPEWMVIFGGCQLAEVRS